MILYRQKSSGATDTGQLPRGSEMVPLVQYCILRSIIILSNNPLCILILPKYITYILHHTALTEAPHWLPHTAHLPWGRRAPWRRVALATRLLDAGAPGEAAWYCSSRRLAPPPPPGRTATPEAVPPESGAGPAATPPPAGGDGDV